jgi:hypothetical protein
MQRLPNWSASHLPMIPSLWAWPRIPCDIVDPCLGRKLVESSTEEAYDPL